jgi:hypothetical protein
MFMRVLKLGSSIAMLRNSRVASAVFVFFHAEPIVTSPWSPTAQNDPENTGGYRPLASFKI